MLLHVEPERPVNPYSPLYTPNRRATQTLRNSAKLLKWTHNAKFQTIKKKRQFTKY